MGINQFEETLPYIFAAPILAASTPVNQTLDQGLTKVIRIDKILVSTDDTAAVLLHLYQSDGFGTLALMGSLLLPALAGFDPTIPSHDLLTVAGLDGLGIAMTGAAQLVVGIPAAMTAGKTLFITAIGGFIPI